jgi:2-polyprenyl-3-methyl-5-hydroxy-6-metoxy-1,4-benzoquinol methylase
VRAIEARRRRLVVEAVLAERPRVVVDVGCEDGWIAEAYAPHVERVVLADLDPRVLAAAPVGCETVVADACRPRALREHLGEARADVIVLSALLEHLPEPAVALDALESVLRPGGAFVVYLPADRAILRAKRVLKATGIGRFVKGLSLEPAPGHLHVFGTRDVRALLEPFGTVERLSFDPLCLGHLAVLRSGGAA